MTTTIREQHKWLLRKFHTLCTRNGVSADQKLALIGSFGVESSKDMTSAQLLEACDLLEKIADPKAEKQARLRKRVMASIGAWLKAIGKEADADYIKSVACRAAGIDNFNRIPAARLTNLYNLFNKKRRDAEAVDRVCGAIAYGQRFNSEPGAEN